MNNEIIPCELEGTPVRGISLSDKPWFVLTGMSAY